MKPSKRLRLVSEYQALFALMDPEDSQYEEISTLIYEQIESLIPGLSPEEYGSILAGERLH
jgi:hypothetical protein